MISHFFGRIFFGTPGAEEAAGAAAAEAGAAAEVVGADPLGAGEIGEADPTVGSPAGGLLDEGGEGSSLDGIGEGWGGAGLLPSKPGGHPEPSSTVVALKLAVSTTDTPLIFTVSRSLAPAMLAERRSAPVKWVPAR
jgi:hypothetical protein